MGRTVLASAPGWRKNAKAEANSLRVVGNSKGNDIMRIIKPYLLPLPLTLSACVLVTDFGDTDDDGGTGGTGGTSDSSEALEGSGVLPDDGADDGADGNADVPPAVDPPSVEWFSVMDHDTDYQSYFIGLELGADGQIYAAGGMYELGAYFGTGLVHGHAATGERNLELATTSAWPFDDACRTPDGRFFGVSRGPSFAEFKGSIGVIQMASDGTVLSEVAYDDPVLGAYPSDGFADIFCDDQGGASVLLTTGEGLLMLELDVAGGLTESWPFGVGGPGDEGSLDYDQGVLHVLSSTGAMSLWQQIDATQTVVAEYPMPHRAAEFDVRGERLVTRTYDHDIVYFDLEGNVLWSLFSDNIVPGPTELDEIALGPDGEVVVNGRTREDDFENEEEFIALIDAQGTVQWTQTVLPLGEGSEWITAIDIAIDETGAIVLAGSEGWSGTPWVNGKPGEPGMERGWIARYAAP